ncbi:MAG: Lactam utilization protein LamB [uncultured Sulfurovum sp.]|uniref:Lactam utilization protein LamB n=1 Tax=uncultured Sulfurovum sp. TaxID=269237 RepID=A0A6S6S9K0_9BACT|nr:MAG: Lactam utilization protein LamB [uncultured Sulfurovum sp.]
MNIKLNCDMGEGFGTYSMGLDEKIMPYIQMANLACGFHAADPVTMHKSIKLCKEHDIQIGCHPSYPDLVGFGRREMNCSSEEIVAFVLYQLGALSALCKSYGVTVSYLKPHGALYNQMMQDESIFRSIAKAVAKFDTNLKLMILSSSKNDNYANIANKYNISLLYEVFADRAYTNEGLLVPRGQHNAVISGKEEVLERAKQLMRKGSLKSISGKKLKLKADALCVHGDNKSALKLIKSLHKLQNDF